MATWAELQNELKQVEPEGRGAFIAERSHRSIAEIARIYDRNILYYASGFLQKPQVPGLFTSINTEDINGYMAGVHGHDFEKGLLLILHTPGGLAESAQTIVSYIRSKYNAIDVLIPTYAMSAGTMISLACDRIIMGRQSQLGPTDPQLIVGDRPYSAHSIVGQFAEAQRDIIRNPILAHAWAPVLRSFGPALLQEARNSIAYGQNIVQDWLQRYMFSDCPDSAKRAEEVAGYFSGDEHKSHGRRIGRDEARSQGLEVIDLEEDQDFQDEVLTLYHLSTIAFEMGPALKSIMSSNGRLWVKNQASAIVVEGA